MNISGVFEKSRRFFQKPYDGVVSKLRSISMSGGDDASKAIITLTWAVINADSKAPESEVEEFRRIIASRYPEIPEKMTGDLLGRKISDEDVAAAAEKLSDLSEKDKAGLLRALIEVACSDNNYCDGQKRLVRKIGGLLGFPESRLPAMETGIQEDFVRRRKILRSGTGIILALSVILIFILTATFLKSVFFGLILAYFFLPVEKWFERRFFPSRPVRWCEGVLSSVVAPLRNLAAFLKGRFSGPSEPESSEEIDKKRVESLVTKASVATVVSFFVIILLVASFFVSLSASYMSGLQKSVGKIADKVKVEIDKTKTEIEKRDNGGEGLHGSFQKYFDGIEQRIEGLKPGLEKSALFKKGVEYVRQYLQDEHNLKSLGVFLLSKTGGVFSFTAGFVGGFFTLVFNLVMTVFFFILLLQKMAMSESMARGGPRGSASSATIGNIFASKWMPATSEESRTEATSILENVLAKLKAWVRGYLSIIIIEAVLYTTAFIILGVPYAHIVGVCAGCTILLPYVGPASSVALTVLVYFAGAADPSMMSVLCILGVYVLISGIFEQFVLYPIFIGESLGLSTIETIAIVLLGGALAGVTGMIFAVPAASVLKYLVAKSYKCWQ